VRKPSGAICAPRLIQGRQILAHRAADRCPIRPVGLCARHTTLPVRIGLHQAGIDREPFTTHQPLAHAALQHLLEHEPQRIAVAKPAVAVLGERRVVRDRAFQAQPAEPAIRQVQMDLLAQPSLRPDAEAVTDGRSACESAAADQSKAGRYGCRTGRGVGATHPDRGTDQCHETGDRQEHAIRD